MRVFNPILLISIITILFLTCGNRKLHVPEGILEPDELAPLLVELHLVDGSLHQYQSSQQLRKDSAYFLYPAVLQKYGISRAQFDSTILFYGKYPEKFSMIYDDVLEELSRREGDVRIIVDSLPKGEDY